ncbi:glycosyltransferase family 2 protein [Evansella clarkii]|uniref:glycosyltransferase family 2 protein n=1 Tax=Evansella clarkii TaxID=79879 RepID=UPI000998AA4F|nr:glycosyltransferase family A protein [Evansella clarkii]
MLKGLVKKSSNVLERSSLKLIGPKQREMIKNSLTDRQKQFIKKFMFAGKWQRREIKEVKHRLYNLGFTKRGYEDLQAMAEKKDEPYLNRLAFWELALWHANQYNKADAQKALEYFSEALIEEKDPVKLRQTAIMKAESLEILGETDRAKDAISRKLVSEQHPDLYLAASNLEKTMSERLQWINKMYSYYNLAGISLEETKMDKPAYDRLVVKQEQVTLDQEQNSINPKITVIMPVYNAEDVIDTSLSSVLVQTWTNLEVLVVDDCSKDNTVKIVETYVNKDPRVRLLKAEKNGGAYMARNLALKEATGEFVTIHDADDWSHPQKMEIQVRHLIDHPDIKGNTSQQARATNDLKFYRRGKPGIYIFSNMSSFMFRRKEVMKELGYWDSVRFAADSEFIRRIKKVFGEKSVTEVPTGPLSFQRQTETSLTGNSAFGYHGYKMGARREYEEGHDYFHAISENLYYDFPQTKRPFSAPEPMWPNKEEKTEGYRTFDVILGADLRTDAEKVIRDIEKIKASKGEKCRIGLIQLSEYTVSPDKKTDSEIRERLEDTVQTIVYGEKVRCEYLLILNPAALNEWQKYIPEIDADEIHVIVNKLPGNEVKYNIAHCHIHLQEYFGKPGIWFPVTSEIRNGLTNKCAAEIREVNIAEKEWQLEEINGEQK